MKQEEIDYFVRYAIESDYEEVTNFIDNNFTKEGYGFVNRGQIQTEIQKGRVLIAVSDVIVGVRIGIKRMWNLVVKVGLRGMGIGEALVNYKRPSIIRVKSQPVGHLSNEQKDGFIDPTGFYEKMGFVWCGDDFGRNFHQRAGVKSEFHVCGEKRHIQGYIDPEQVLL